VTLKKGFHYVVVQHFPKRSGRTAASEAARYLIDNGVACATLEAADIRLVATEPFLIEQADSGASRREQQRANALVARIKELGEQYARQLAREGKPTYSFAGCGVRRF
jgi:hypothetical protein